MQLPPILDPTAPAPATVVALDEARGVGVLAIELRGERVGFRLEDCRASHGLSPEPMVGSTTIVRRFDAVGTRRLATLVEVFHHPLDRVAGVSKTVDRACLHANVIIPFGRAAASLLGDLNELFMEAVPIQMDGNPSFALGCSGDRILYATVHDSAFDDRVLESHAGTGGAVGRSFVTLGSGASPLGAALRRWMDFDGVIGLLPGGWLRRVARLAGELLSLGGEIVILPGCRRQAVAPETWRRAAGDPGDEANLLVDAFVDVKRKDGVFWTAGMWHYDLPELVLRCGGPGPSLGDDLYPPILLAACEAIVWSGYLPRVGTTIETGLQLEDAPELSKVSCVVVGDDDVDLEVHIVGADA